MTYDRECLSVTVGWFWNGPMRSALTICWGVTGIWESNIWTWASWLCIRNVGHTCRRFQILRRNPVHTYASGILICYNYNIILACHISDCDGYLGYFWHLPHHCCFAMTLSWIHYAKCVWNVVISSRQSFIVVSPASSARSTASQILPHWSRRCRPVRKWSCRSLRRWWCR